MNFIQQENLRLKLEWLRKFHSGYVGYPAWPMVYQQLFDKDLARKRRKAIDYLTARRKVGKNVIPFPYRHFAGRLR